MPDPQHKFRLRTDVWEAAGIVLEDLDNTRTITITVLPGATRSSVCTDAIRRVAELEPAPTTPTTPENTP